MASIDGELLAGISLAPTLPEDDFADLFTWSPAWMGKPVHYIGGLITATGTQGMGANADYGFVTLPLQDNAGSLAVQPHGREARIPVDPLPGALVVAPGEMLEVATNGLLMATVHSVTASPPGIGRYFVPFFWSPRLNAVIDTVPLPAELAAETLGVSDDPDNPMLSSYGSNVFKGWVRAHPQTAAIHYPEMG